ncbi:MAG: arsenate reductase family protein [Spirochaetaceae bacterium]
MTPQLIGTGRSKDTRRIERYLKERRIEFQLVDLSQRGLSVGELEAVAAAVGGFEELVDTASRSYRKRGMTHMEYDSREELLEDPSLLRVPIVRTDRGAAINPDNDTLTELLRLG